MKINSVLKSITLFLVQMPISIYSIAQGASFAVEIKNDSIVAPESRPSYIVQPGGFSIFQSATSILLLDGFEAHNGSYFHAFIAQPNCQSDFRVGETHNNSLNGSNLSDYTQSDIFFLYPNPTLGVFHVTIFEDVLKKNTIYLYNMFGKIISGPVETSNRKFQFDISNMPRGVYFVKIIQGDRASIKKVILM